MSDEEWQEARQHAAEVSREVGLRRLKLGLFIGAAVAVAVALGAAAATYFGQQEDINAGVSLADQVAAACTAGAIEDPAARKRLCEQAEEVQATVKEGPQGIAGVDGADGVNGVDGAPGSPGASGRPGRDGKNGEDGEDGEDGAAGASGAPGSDSTVPGSPGPSGAPGADGSDGADGRGVASVECTSGTGSFTFHYTDGTTETVECSPADPAPEPSSSTGPAAARR